MEIKEARESEAKLWDKFVMAHSPSTFGQSWAWGEVAKREKRPLCRVVVTDEGEFAAIALLLLYRAPLGFSYVYSPGGPVVRQGLSRAKTREALMILARKARECFRVQKPAFARFEPENSVQFPAPPYRKVSGGRRHLSAVEPAARGILTLTKTPEELLAAMKQKTRYNIRRAEKLGVETNITATPAAFEVFWRLLKETSNRNKFHTHPKEHYEATFNVFSVRKAGSIVTATYKGEVCAALFLIFFGTRAVYLHGGSSRRHRTAMAPYAAHWYAINQARRRGCSIYDFGGVSEGRSSAWAGLSRFKFGFGAETVRYENSMDVPLRPLRRRLFYTLRRIRHS